jgi:hypothetical protein
MPVKLMPCADIPVVKKTNAIKNNGKRNDFNGVI